MDQQTRQLWDLVLRRLEKLARRCPDKASVATVHLARATEPVAINRAAVRLRPNDAFVAVELRRPERVDLLRGALFSVIGAWPRVELVGDSDKDTDTDVPLSEDCHSRAAVRRRIGGPPILCLALIVEAPQ